MKSPTLPALKRHSIAFQPALLFIAAGFVAVGAITLYFARPTLSSWNLLILTAGWSVAWGGSFLVLRSRLPQADPFILPVVALLSGWGLLLLARLAPAALLRQVLWLQIGCAAMCAVALLPTLPRRLRRYRYSLLAAGLLLLGATLVFGVNPSGIGQRLWLGAFGAYYQPSELLKLLLVIYLAAYLAESPLPAPSVTPEKTKGLGRFLPWKSANKPLWIVILGPMFIMVGLALLLVGWQQDLGAALLFYFTFVAMLYLAWNKVEYVALSLVLFVPVAVVGYFVSSRVALRIGIWLNPWLEERADQAFQILQSLFAFASGGLFGQGLGQGYPTLIPAVHTDFVYAALVEEFGIAGAIALFALFGLLIQRGVCLAQRAESPFESLLAGGITAMLGIQTWVIIGGNAKLIPITGVTLPFLSYGGSSLLVMLIAVGILLNLSTPHPVPLTLALADHKHTIIPRTTGRLGRALLILLVSTALITGYWGVPRANALRAHHTNSRIILAEARIRRGRILDRNGAILADITLDKNGYVTRTYPLPEAAAVIGYATYEYGTDGIEAACDSRLRGDVDRTYWDTVRDGLLHHDPVGEDVRLTLDGELQRQAQQLLKGERGAAILVDAHTGEILALASMPIYQSDQVDSDWETLRDDPSAPLLNRATKGLAQPGAILETVLLGITLEEGQLPEVSLPMTKTYPVNGAVLMCNTFPAINDWATALQETCPAPFVALGRQLGMARLADGFTRWGLTEAPRLEIPTFGVPWNNILVTAAQESDPQTFTTQEALGQGNLLVTPLQMVQVAATLGNEGQRPPLHLLIEERPGCLQPNTQSGDALLTPEAAAQLRALWPHYGDAIGHAGNALAGHQRIQSWFIGLNSPQVPRYAVAILLENPHDPQRAADIGLQLLQQAVAPH
ncbi:MAG: FtsW/RodA/SpoVE family cell cycle protein [Anaerolineae bacterium]|nr:FtsW/RodA/SpoVE family cell cycle protein [Anaerolineae bacterium]